ncbi:tissue factor pathway inhibitor-like [Dermacentor silvarum]|uniref:tissue factor pathway inhibitor-like n=1 Tax=Dermacentor silvarum TaxID=543639 RepID=UPI002101C128|nr:tissue factor pathway inhibitor-like [Dermacentor silvarum]
MRRRTATLCWILLGLGVMCAADKDKKATKETVKKGSGDPYWCGPKLEEVCYEGDSKEDKGWNVDDSDKGKQKNENKDKKEKPMEENKEEQKKEDKKTTVKPVPTTTEKPKACQKDFDSGPCFSSKPMYYYRKESKKCEMFVYGGCGGNDNRFDTQKACEERCARG